MKCTQRLVLDTSSHPISMSAPTALVVQETLLDRFALALAAEDNALAASLRIHCLAEPHLALGVPLLASHETARAARNKLFVVHHPDKGGSAQAFDLVTQCFDAFVSSGAATPTPCAELVKSRERHAAFLARCDELLSKIDALPNECISVPVPPVEETPEPDVPTAPPRVQKKRKAAVVVPVGARLRSADFKNRLRVRK